MAAHVARALALALALATASAQTCPPGTFDFWGTGLNCPGVSATSSPCAPEEAQPGRRLLSAAAAACGLPLTSLRVPCARAPPRPL
jgi:hypothetical protein